MKLFAVILGAFALVAGVTGGLRAYSSSASAGPPVETAHATVHHYPPAQVVRPGVVLKWAPCRKPAVREGRACVTHVTHTVALPPPAVVSAPPVAAPTTTTADPQQDATTHPTQTPQAPQSAPPGDDHGDESGGDDGGTDD